MNSGTYEIGPSNGKLLLRTGREGAAAKMGHDLTLAVGKWSATVAVDADQPSRTSVNATIDAGSITVQEGHGGATALSAKQSGDIEKNIREKVLKTDKNPQITFRSTAVSGDPSAPKITGDLTIAGATRPVTLDLTVMDGAGTVQVTGSTRIVQTEFGIKPFSAMLGALKVKDVLELDVDVALPG